MPRRSLVPVLVLLLAGISGADEKPSEMYAEKESKFLRAIAAKYVELGDEAKKAKLYQFAREAYQEALAYEEHNPDAREALGFVRRGREWTVDPKEAAKLPEQNQRAQNMTDTAFKKLTDEHEERKAKTEKYAAAKYAGLGEWCVKQGLNDQGVKAFEKALTLDSENADARKGLGYRKVDGEWLTEKQIRAREEAKEGKVLDAPSPVGSKLGLKFNRVESAHFLAESVFPIDTVKSYVKTLETAYAYFVRDVGEAEVRDVWGRKANFIVLADVPQWHRYVDLFSGGSAADKEFTKKTQGSQNVPGLTGVQYENSDHQTTLDGLVHKCSHMLAHHYWGLDHAWLLEGFAYYYTVKVLESTRTHCVARGDYNNPHDGSKDWGQSENWKELVKKDVQTKGDPDVRMFHRQSIGELPYNASVKAWSMISWLFDKHREKFMTWLSAVGKGGKPQEQALQEVFGWSFEQLDKEWRAFVLENY